MGMPSSVCGDHNGDIGKPVARRHRARDVLESAKPPMVTAGALTISHRLAPRLAAAMAGYASCSPC
jgi:hypothetical protein